MAQSWKADPLHWGHGPSSFEVFLEPTCPFSARTFRKLDDFLDYAGPDRVTVKLRLQSQPWHMFSAVIVRTVLAASITPGGKAAAKAVMAAVAADPAAYEFTHHAGGPNLNETPAGVLRRIEAATGLTLQAAFAVPDLDREIKWHCKYARQNGIHVSPTFMVNGLVAPQLGSGDPVEDWVKAL